MEEAKDLPQPENKGHGIMSLLASLRKRKIGLEVVPQVAGRELNVLDISKQLFITVTNRLRRDDVVTMRRWPEENDGKGLEDENFVVLTSADGKINIAIAARKETPRIDIPTSRMPSTSMLRISWWEVKGRSHGTLSYMDDRKRPEDEKEHRAQWYNLAYYDGIAFENQFSTNKSDLASMWEERSGVFCYPSPSEREQTPEELASLESLIRTAHRNDALTKTAMEFHRDRLHQMHVNASQIGAGSEGIVPTKVA